MQQVWRTNDGKIWETRESAIRWEQRANVVTMIQDFLYDTASINCDEDILKEVSSIIVDNAEWFLEKLTPL